MRAQLPEVGITAEELLAVYGSTGPHLSEEALDRIQDADTSDQPREDKWDRH